MGAVVFGSPHVAIGLCGGMGQLLIPKLLSFPKTNLFDNFFWLHLQLMYPKKVEVGLKPKQIFSRSIVLYPVLKNGIVSPLFRWLVEYTNSNYCSLKLLSAPNWRSPATCNFGRWNCIKKRSSIILLCDKYIIGFHFLSRVLAPRQICAVRDKLNTFIRVTGYNVFYRSRSVGPCWRARVSTSRVDSVNSASGNRA